MARAAPIFYCVQGEDNMNHPNAFFVPKPEGGKAISFDAFLQHFPFSSEAFHFRFQVIPEPSHTTGLSSTGPYCRQQRLFLAAVAVSFDMTVSSRWCHDVDPGTVRKF